MKKAFVLTLPLALALTTMSAGTAYAALTRAQQGSNIQSINSSCSFNAGSSGLDQVVTCIASVLQNIIVLLIAGSVVYVIYGAFEMIRSEDKREEGKSIILHGVIGLFVMVSIWGLVNILSSTFSLDNNMPSVPTFNIK